MAKEIICDTSDLERLIKGLEGILEDGTIRQCVAGALNDTLPHIAAQTKREVQAEYLITKSIDKTLEKKKAKTSDLTAEARYTDKPLPLFVFKHSAPTSGNRSPVKIARIAGKSKTVGYSSEGEGVFKTKNYRHKKIMVRAAGQRNIRTAYSVSIPQMVANDGVYEAIAKDAEPFIYRRLEYRINKRLDKL